MTGTARSRPWRVVRQYSNQADQEICTHRWEWTAELCAARRVRRREHWSEVGVFYTVRPAATA